MSINENTKFPIGLTPIAKILTKGTYPERGIPAEINFKMECNVKLFHLEVDFANTFDSREKITGMLYNDYDFIYNIDDNKSDVHLFVLSPSRESILQTQGVSKCQQQMFMIEVLTNLATKLDIQSAYNFWENLEYGPLCEGQPSVNLPCAYPHWVIPGSFEDSLKTLVSDINQASETGNGIHGDL